LAIPGCSARVESARGEGVEPPRPDEGGFRRLSRTVLILPYGVRPGAQA
jgi:hypothetical protein